MSVVYCDYDPHESLRPWIASYWTLTVAADAQPSVHTPPLDGCAHLGFRAGHAALLGPRATPFQTPIAPGDDWFGIRFRPGAARAFMRLPRELHLRDALVPAYQLEALHWALPLANAKGEARIGEADALLRSQSANAAPIDAVVANALEAILAAPGTISIAALAEASGLSERQLRRRFTEAVDLSPKEFATIWRLRLCASDRVGKSGESWAALAVTHGFADQSHLVREFRRLFGMTPDQVERHLSAIEHRALNFPRRAQD